MPTADLVDEQAAVVADRGRCEDHARVDEIQGVHGRNQATAVGLDQAAMQLRPDLERDFVLGAFARRLVVDLAPGIGRLARVDDDHAFGVPV